MSTTPARIRPHLGVAARGGGTTTGSQFDDALRRQPASSAAPGATAQPRPCVLQVYRPSLRRWVVVAKFLRLRGSWALAIPYRHRQRLDLEVSLPVVVVEWAAQRGAEAVFVRFDAEGRTLYLPLGDALRLGRRKPVDGQEELWIPLDIF